MGSGGHSMVVPHETLENVHDAMEELRKKIDVKMTQPKFFEYLFLQPEKVADIVYENYAKRFIMK